MKITATGKSVEIAIQNGLLECGLTREEVEIKVIENGGLFKKAKVELSWGETNAETTPAAQSEESADKETTQPASQTSQEEAEEEASQPTKASTPKQKKVRAVPTDALAERCQTFLTGLINHIDNQAQISLTTAENEISFSITGSEKGLSRLIGYHGDTLKSLQTLLSGLKSRNESPIRIYVDVNGYKLDKQQTLISLANKTADQAVNIGRNIHLDPMNAYDRRIIHTTLQERADVTTESTGEGEKRHVVVKPVFKK